MAAQVYAFLRGSVCDNLTQYVAYLHIYAYPSLESKDINIVIIKCDGHILKYLTGEKTFQNTKIKLRGFD